MSKKTKRSKKGRKGSRVDSTSSKRGRDEVTGLSVSFGPYGKLKEDTVYGQEVFEKAARANNPDLDFETTGRSQLEIELSAKQLVITTTFIADDMSNGGNGYQRLLLSGDFVYKKGALASARIDSASSLNYSFYKNGDIYLESAYVEDFQNSRSITNPDSAEQWERVFSEDGSVLVMEAQRSYPANPADTGRIEEIYGYGGGRIFEANWWQDPFAPNLI